jgi:hypothetical protein
LFSFLFSSLLLFSLIFSYFPVRFLLSHNFLFFFFKFTFPLFSLFSLIFPCHLLSP